MLVFLLMGTPFPEQNVALGFITQPTGGHVNNAAASAGTTIYDGDQVTTDANGGLTLRFGTSQLILAGHSAVLLKHRRSGMTPILQHGTVAFKLEGVESFKFGAGDVRVRPR
jgi:hypothetical protein